MQDTQPEDRFPEFQEVEWPRLERLRAERQPLITDYEAQREAQRILTARFADEDRRAREAELVAAREDGEAAEIATTPQLRREAQLEVAGARVASAQRKLNSHRRSASDELFTHQYEVEEAVAAVRAACVPPIPPEPDPSPTAGGRDPMPIEVGSAEERALDAANRNWQQLHSGTLRRLEADCRALAMVFGCGPGALLHER